LAGFVVSAAIAATVAGDPRPAADQRATFLFFWGIGCPHCAEAHVFVERLEQEHSDLRFESWEVRRNPEGRRRFSEEAVRLGIPKPSIPTFVCGTRYVVGFTKGTSEPLLRDLAHSCS
jgi:hypothetical protein